MNSCDIPVIDISRTGGDPREVSAVARQLDRACRDIGFFFVTGHGTAPELIQDAHTELVRFFDLPIESKDACRPVVDKMPGDEWTPYGYSGLLEENAFAYMGQAGQPSDYVEKFSVGGFIKDDCHPLPFPDGQAGARLRATLKAYYLACEDLSARILELVTVAMNYPRNYFSRRIDQSKDSLRAHRYPRRGPELANEQGMGEHTDGTLITLLTHTAPGIEVQTTDGRWITPSCLGVQHFLVNIGDLLHHWTQRQYLSTRHRATLLDHVRQSIVFFKLTNDDELVLRGNQQMDALFGHLRKDPPDSPVDQ